MVSHTPVRATANATSAKGLRRSPNKIALSIALSAGVRKNKLLTRAAEWREMSSIISITAAMERTSTDHSKASTGGDVRLISARLSVSARLTS